MNVLTYASSSNWKQKSLGATEGNVFPPDHHHDPRSVFPGDHSAYTDRRIGMIVAGLPNQLDGCSCQLGIGVDSALAPIHHRSSGCIAGCCCKPPVDIRRTSDHYESDNQPGQDTVPDHTHCVQYMRVVLLDASPVHIGSRLRCMPWSRPNCTRTVSFCLGAGC